MVSYHISRATLALAFAATALMPLTARAENIPELEWIRQFGSSDADSGLGADAHTPGTPGETARAHAVGSTDGVLAGSSSAGGTDAYYRVYDISGNLIYEEQFGTSGNDKAVGVATMSYGHIAIVVGTTTGTFPGQTSAGGQDLFFRIYNDGVYTQTIQMGSSGTDEVFDVASDNFRAVVAGSTTGSFDGHTPIGGRDALVFVMNPDGTLSWSYVFGTTEDDEARGANLSTADERVFVSGTTNGTFPNQSSSGGSDAFVQKYTMGGVELWTRQFGTSGNDEARSASGNAYGVSIGGQTDEAFPGFSNAGGADAFVRSYDSDGNVRWTHQVGTNGVDTVISGDTGSGNDHSYILGTTTGVLPGQSSAGGTDMFLRKLSSTGGTMWTRQIGTSGTDSAKKVALAISSVLDANVFSLYAAGETNGAFAGSSSAGSTDAFFIKFQQDEDSDAIYNEIDQAPEGFSDTFTDGVTQGAIEERGTQDLVIIDAQNPSVGVSIRARGNGNPAEPAIVNACNDGAISALEPGDAVNMTCGSAIVEVIQGQVETTFNDYDGFSATTSYDAGNTVHFTLGGGHEFQAPAENDDTVDLSIGPSTQSLPPGKKLVFLQATKDSFLRKGHQNQNEGANPIVLVRNQGDIRSLFAFDLAGINVGDVSKATLLLTVNASTAPSGWGPSGRMIDAHRLSQDFSEGNGKDIDVPAEESTRGTGAGVTWNCSSDSDIANQQKDCGGDWKGGENAWSTPTSPGFLMTNGFLGQASWNVTSDVLAGGSRWILKKRDENKAGHVQFYSKEGTSEPNFVPQLVLELENE